MAAGDRIGIVPGSVRDPPRTPQPRRSPPARSGAAAINSLGFGTHLAWPRREPRKNLAPLSGSELAHLTEILGQDSTSISPIPELSKPKERN